MKFKNVFAGEIWNKKLPKFYMKLKYQLLINYDSRKTKKLQIDLNIFDRVIWITLFPFIPFFFYK